ncbi:restriction endonuclease, SacI family [Mesorhizobium sp. LHD-90]|uniref:restriction endonuclease, SacI family n=1 Tax=Mesorhizobium sp. LHD-90 TaxID=3071414 RepID=UPI0027E05FE8|nr:restriction endonuclease, SacI family [Mesorhizobium sp. LHD-90]MDQ6433772.1 restriction endonuclease, SacI family [Mesorhizobium sp. LHD-90]
MADLYDKARELLAEAFSEAEDDFRDGKLITLPSDVMGAIERTFASKTQAYREALVGCALTRLVDETIDVRYPATAHGDKSFSGRGVSDQVVAPFLQSKRVPISVSPYLSALRGGAKFVPGGQPRIQRDQPAFDALVKAVSYVADANPDETRALLRRLLREFIQLRESANISLKRTAKPSVFQLDKIADTLLRIKSGGRIASFLTIAMFQALSDRFTLGWEVDFQGINVADKFTGAVGDVTVKKNGDVVLGVEITERPIGKARVSLVFEDKVSPAGLIDYLFVTTALPEADAIVAAKNYTAVGNDMNFVDLRRWLHHLLATIGPVGRLAFQDRLIAQLTETGVPAELKLAWNDALEAAIGGAT